MKMPAAALARWHRAPIARSSREFAAHVSAGLAPNLPPCVSRNDTAFVVAIGDDDGWQDWPPDENPTVRLGE